MNMPPAPQYNPQDLLDAVIAQRNALMNESAMGQAIIKAKAARIAELEAEIARLKPAGVPP